MTGELPGAEIHLPLAAGTADPNSFNSIVPVDRFEIWSNGGVVKTLPLTDGGKRGMVNERSR